MVIQRPREQADLDEQEGLDGAYPRDGRGRVCVDEMVLIISLEDAKGDDQAPGRTESAAVGVAGSSTKVSSC